MAKKDIELDELESVNGGVSTRWLQGHGVGAGSMGGGNHTYAGGLGGSPTIDPHAQIPAGTLPGHYPTGAGPHGVPSANGHHQSDTAQLIQAGVAALPRIIDAFTGHGSQGRGGGSLLSNLFGGNSGGNNGQHPSSNVGGGSPFGGGMGPQGGGMGPQHDAPPAFSGSPEPHVSAPHGPVGSSGGQGGGPAGATGGQEPGEGSSWGQAPEGQGSSWGQAPEGQGSSWGQAPEGQGSSWGQAPDAANGDGSGAVYGPPYTPDATPGAQGALDGDYLSGAGTVTNPTAIDGDYLSGAGQYSGASTPDPVADYGDVGGGFNPMGDFTGF